MCTGVVSSAPFCYHSLMRILVAEDEKKIAGFMRKAPGGAGLRGGPGRDGDDAYELATSQSYDVIVLDIMLPGRDGLSILRQLRERHNTVPVILLTARARTRRAPRRAQPGRRRLRHQAVLHGGADRAGAGRDPPGLRRDSSACCRPTTWSSTSSPARCKVGERAVELTAREFGLLEYLMRSPGRVYTRTQIPRARLGLRLRPQHQPGRRVHPAAAQEAGPRRRAPFIETVRGVGYRFRRP